LRSSPACTVAGDLLADVARAIKHAQKTAACPTAQPVSQCASANSFAWEVSSIHPSPRFAASVTAQSVGVRPVSRLKQNSAMKIWVVVVAMEISLSVPTSAAYCRPDAAGRK